MVSTSLVAAVISALPLALAYYPPTNGTTTSASAPSGTAYAGKPVQTVSVGKDGLVFTPDTVHAKTGEEIVFEFFPKNHAVVQADFNNPCNPSADGKAIFSGFIPSAVGRANKTFTIKIEDDTKPIWLYCPQNQPKPHCAAGMVAVINPPPSPHNTLNAFRLIAAQTNGTGSTAPSSGPYGGEVTTPGTPSATSGAPSPSDSSPAESPGAASSIAISGALVMAAIFAGIML
ncbi:hypothetical protein N0V90_004927 [Kalmusia sp. IMI 367209]|nr:hypothetical protein N0V90_004927 [Kalmusia sp. IMI 367209]